VVVEVEVEIPLQLTLLVKLVALAVVDQAMFLTQ
jgi:hypothetical protein